MSYILKSSSSRRYFSQTTNRFTATNQGEATVFANTSLAKATLRALDLTKAQRAAVTVVPVAVAAVKVAAPKVAVAARVAAAIAQLAPQAQVADLADGEDNVAEAPAAGIVQNADRTSFATSYYGKKGKFDSPHRFRTYDEAANHGDRFKGRRQMRVNQVAGQPVNAWVNFVTNRTNTGVAADVEAAAV